MQQKSIKKNMIINVGMKVINYVFPLIIFKWVSNVIYADGVGQVSFVRSVIQYFILFSVLGMPTYGVRICAQHRNDKVQLTKIVKELFLIEMACTVISYIALTGFVFLVPELNLFQ